MNKHIKGSTVEGVPIFCRESVRILQACNNVTGGDFKLPALLECPSVEIPTIKGL